MLPSPRRSVASRLLALLVLASFWTLFHPASDDACATGVLPVHDEAQHAIAAAEDTAPAHCAVCHSIRSPRRFDSPAQLPTPFRAGIVIHSIAANRPLSRGRTGVPARAPPSSLS